MPSSLRAVNQSDDASPKWLPLPLTRFSQIANAEVPHLVAQFLQLSFGVADVGHGRFDLGEDGGIIDGGGRSVQVPVGDLLHGATQDFARARFGKALHDDGYLE
jgi:hypothetical protein